MHNLSYNGGGNGCAEMGNRTAANWEGEIHVKKKQFLFVLTALLLLCLSVSAAHAATPDDMTYPQVTGKLDLLVEQLNNKYFTTDRKAAYSNTAETCNMSNVVRTNWLGEAAGGMVPDELFKSGTFLHYYNGTTLTRGYSCCGFANYALWYVFAQDSADIVKGKEVGFYTFNKTNMLRYAQPGDVLRLGDYSSGAGSHSVILYSIGEDSITVVDSNWSDGTDRCKVTKHTIRYAAYNYVGVTRAKNYEYPTGLYAVCTDGGLNQRSGIGSDYAVLQTVPDGANVRVIDTRDNWGKYEYNGTVGWSNMDYMRFRGTYVATVTFDAGGGSGEMEPIWFTVGTGFDAPECTFTRPGYKFLGWTLENTDLGKIRCVGPDGDVMAWMTESEAKAQGYTKYLFTTGLTYNRNTSGDRGTTFRMTAQWAPEGCEAPAMKLKNNAATGQPYLWWDAVDGAVKYEIHRATSKNGTYYKLWTTTQTTYNNTTAQPGKTYYYKVCAIDEQGRAGAFSTVKSLTCDCAQPEVKIITLSATGQPYLWWDKVPGAERYEIHRATSPTGTYIKMWTTTSTSYTNTTAQPGVTYYYKIRAVDDASSYATSAFSAVKSVTCDCAAPVVSITRNNAGMPYLTWKAVPGAQKYYVYRAVDGGEMAYYYTATTNSFTNTSAKSGTKYSYQVRAVGPGSYANSAYSNKVTITVK